MPCTRMVRTAWGRPKPGTPVRHPAPAQPRTTDWASCEAATPLGRQSGSRPCDLPYAVQLTNLWSGRRSYAAVKELRAPHGLSEGERAVFGERALREGRTAGRVNHPGVVAIHDLVRATAADEAVHIVMELVEAPSLNGRSGVTEC